MKNLIINTSYDEDFYNSQVSDSLRSAKVYAEYLCQFVQPNSVVDFGCGWGTWLHAFALNGVENLIGYDGSWNSQEKMINDRINFIGADLNKPINCSTKFDLAISLEVAEHLRRESADTFIESLVRASDIILFGAAYPGQGGTDHINERPQSYWAEKFISLDYSPFDVLRPVFWGCKDVEYWYRQNSFIYIKNNTLAFNKFIKNGFRPIERLEFMNCVHPEAYALSILQRNNLYKFKRLLNFIKLIKHDK